MDDSFLEAYKKAREQKAGNQPTSEQPSSPEQPANIKAVKPVTESDVPTAPGDTAPTTSPETPTVPADNTENKVTSESAQITETKPMPSFLAGSEVKTETPATPKTEVISPESKGISVKQARLTKLGSRNIVIAIVLLALIIIAAFTYLQRDTLVRGLNSYKAKKTPRPTVQVPSAADQALARNYIAEVAKLMELPAGENPTVAAITDVAKLRSSENGNLPIFQKAKNGDVLIIYSTKAILYDPIKKVIVDVANVNIAKLQTATSSATLASASPVATAAPTAKPATVVQPTTQTATTSATQ